MTGARLPPTELKEITSGTLDHYQQNAEVFRAATAKEPGDRPSPLEFGRAFASAL